MGEIIGENPSNDWSIHDLYEKAFAMVKSNKVLWIFGMAAATLGAGGCNYNFSQLGNIFPDQGKPLQDIPTTPPATYDQISQVLGTNTNQVFGIIGQFFSGTPVYFWIILAVEILALVLLGLIINLINNAWSNAALIHGIQSAVDNKKPSLRESSEKAFTNIKSLIWLKVVPTLVLGLATLITLGLLFAGLSLIPSLRIIFILLIIIAIFGLLFVFLFLSLSQIWAPRLVILENLQAKESLLKGLRISKKKFWSMMLLAMVNTILTAIIMGTIIALIVGLVFVGALSFGANQVIGIALIVIGGILILTFIFGWILISGFLTAFKASVWTLAYNNIRGKYDGN